MSELKTVNADHYIHGLNMIEEYGIHPDSIKAAKRTCWNNRTEMQVFAVGVDHGYELGILEAIKILKAGDWDGLADCLEVHLKNRKVIVY